MSQPEKGSLHVIGPDDGVSYWQPNPSRGYATVKLSPDNSPYNHFSSGIQVLEPGASVREHGHQRADEMLFVYRGRGHAMLDGERHEIEEGSLLMLGRYRLHEIVNDGDEQMKILWVIFPPGLEHWFEAIGKPRTPGDPLPEPFDRPDDVAEIQKAQRFVNPPAKTSDAAE
jgi:quercetin dioxygenase-like cupin family protein